MIRAFRQRAVQAMTPESRRRFLALTLGLAAAPLAGAAAQEPLPRPSGRVLLTVKGAIERTNADGKAELDLAMLEKIGTSQVQTSTPWTDGRPTFEGVRMRDLLERLGAHGPTVTVVALNDYKMQIPVDDFMSYPVLLAFRMDGKKLRVREKGPLWLVYPQDEFPELQNKPTQAKWVWQVKEIHID
jgi:hypothetical protein